MKTIILIILALALTGCYSIKSMGDSQKAEKYLFVY